jgi:hypothetical protein
VSQASLSPRSKCERHRLSDVDTAQFDCYAIQRFDCFVSPAYSCVAVNWIFELDSELNLAKS